MHVGEKDCGIEGGDPTQVDPDRQRRIGRLIISVVAIATCALAVIGGRLLGPFSISSLTLVAVEYVSRMPVWFFFVPAYSAVGVLLFVSRPSITHRPSGFGSGLRFLLVIALVVFAFRWPLMALHEQTVDESTDIATAITLTVDPVYWRSADVINRGPMNPLFLASFGIVGLPLDYGTAKLANLLLTVSILGLFFLIVREGFGENAARTSVVPLVVFFALLRRGTLLAFNVEYLLTVLFLVFGLVLTLAVFRSGPRLRLVLLAIAGLCLGLVPLTKVQGAPVAAVLGIWAVFLMVRHRRTSVATDLVTFAAGCAFPMVLSVAICVQQGILGDAFHRVVISQLDYAASGFVGMAQKNAIFIRGWSGVNRAVDGYLGLSLCQAVFFGLAAILLVRRSRSASGSLRETEPMLPASRSDRLTTLSFLVVVVMASAFAVWVPGRGAVPYYVILLVPVFVLAGFAYCCVAETTRHRKLWWAVFLVSGLVAPLAQPLSGMWVVPWQDPRVLSPGRLPLGVQKHKVSERVLEYASPREGLFVWGWMDQYHVETGMIFGARTQTQRLMGFNKDGYYTRSLVAELQENRPPVIIDAVNPRSYFFTDREDCGMQLFPEVHAFVQENYCLVEDVEGNRIYLSVERAASRSIRCRE